MTGSAARACLRFAIVLCLGASGCKTHDDTESFQGTVELEQTTLSFDVPGRVAHVAVSRGQTVEGGELLAELDDSLERLTREGLRSTVDAAEARLALLRSGSRGQEIEALGARVEAAVARERAAEREFQRATQLLGMLVAPRARVDDLESRLRQARAERHALQEELAMAREGARAPELEAAAAELGQARAQLELSNERLRHHLLRAPAAGLLSEVVAREGEVLRAGAPAALLVDPTRPYAEIFVPQQRLTEAHLGRVAWLAIDGADRPFAARVVHVSPRTEFTPRFLYSEYERFNLVVRVRLDIDDPERRIVAGVPAFARWDEAPVASSNDSGTKPEATGRGLAHPAIAAQ